MFWKITLICDYTQLNKNQNDVCIKIMIQILKSQGDSILEETME